MQPQANGQQPVYILQQGTEQTNGSAAQRNNINAAKAVGQTVKSTLGPLGMDKMLIDPANNILITNDGVSILREIGIEHPAAKMIVEVAKTQESRCYDGTTSAVVLSGALLEEAERLLDKGIHPTTVCKGYRFAKTKSLELLNELVDKCGIKEKIFDKAFSCAKTSLVGKSAEGIQHHLALLSANVVRKVEDIEDISIISVSGTTEEDTYSISGVVIERDLASNLMTPEIKNAKILMLDCAIEPKNLNLESQVQITNAAQIEEFLLQEEEHIRDMVEIIKSTKANVVLTQKKIDDLALHYLKKYDITAVHSVKKSDLDKVSKISKGNVVSSLTNEIDTNDLGTASFYVDTRYDYDLIHVSNDDSPVHTVIACGATKHVAEEIERALEDSIGVAWLAINNDLLPGGGTVHGYLHHHLMLESSISGREKMAVEAFANALLQIPAAIAENAGKDPINELIALKVAISDENYSYFVDVSDEPTNDVLKAEVFEPIELHRQALTSATEAAVMILRIDDVIRMNPSNAQQPPM